MRGLFLEFRQHISIHAPPRGATTEYTESELPAVFQFTPLREGRLPAVTARRLPKNFNSRPSARGDHPALQHHAHRADFNSRPSARGDPRQFWRQYRHSISIHAPPRGATRVNFGGNIAIPFQFTPLREGRHGDAGVPDDGGISIHAPPRGATRGRLMNQSGLRPFQFTPLREGRP